MMQIKLSDERKTRIKADLIAYFEGEFDDELSDYRANAIVDFMLLQIGPSQYNQAITDACKYMTAKIEDLDTEYFLPDSE